ncbi:MAG: Mth938-like domain-containing protein [Pseudomonadota bacterium]
MPLAEEIVTSRYRINAYSDDSITVNETVYRSSLVLSANEIFSAWPVTSIQQLELEQLSAITDMKPEVVLLGTGNRQAFPPAQIFAHFGQQGIGLEVMDNGALCRTFNILVAEDRAVVAAILIGPEQAGP